MQFIDVRRSGLSEVLAAKKGIASSHRLSFFHPCGLLTVLITGSLLVFSTIRADATGNPAEEIQGQLSPMLDSLTQASVSMARQDRATASTQIGLTISLADGLSSTVESPDIVGVRGKK